jgi:P-type Mg2+ transporter
VSSLTGEWFDARLFLIIVVATIGVGYSREYSARKAIDALGARIRLRSRVVRGGAETLTDNEQLVPGDIVLLSAGRLVPANGVLIEATDFYVSETLLTGESLPVQKQPGAVAAHASLVEPSNCVHLGTNVRTGTASYVVVRTGATAVYGDVAQKLTLRPPETEFDRGIRHFGYLLTTAMLLLVLFVFAAHALRSNRLGRRSRRCCSRSHWPSV